MNFLSLNAGEITGIIGAIATVFTVFIVPFVKWYKKRKIKIQEERLEQERVKQQQVDMIESINALSDAVEQISQNVNENGQKLAAFTEDQEAFTIQNLKFMINNAYLGYHSEHEIPYEVLVNACECCEIYVHKKHQNHEIHPRCERLWGELERRVTNRGDHNE